MEYYAAHAEGRFATIESALQKAGFSAEEINLIISNAEVNLSPALWWPVNDDYGALVTKSSDYGYQLWRGFYGMKGTFTDAHKVVEKFRGMGVSGNWAVFEWTPPLSTANQ
jgi:hypothetical protein